MIRWTSRLYVGDKLKKKQQKAITSINNQEATFDIYCITFASQPCNLFDIINVNEFLFPHYKKSEICIIGLARGKNEAIELVRDMILEVFNETGEFDVRSYFT